MKIVLASKSPRRKELMNMLNIDYEIIVSEVNENLEEGLSPEEQVKRISYKKAKKVFEELKGDRIVIGSDTMVAKDGIIYGKPKNEEDAVKMLSTLKNTFHQAITGLTILIEKNGEIKEFNLYDSTDVYFKDMTEKEIMDWIKTGKAMDKAGAYAVQGEFMVFIDKINGNFSTVMGLPIHKVYEILKDYIK